MVYRYKGDCPPGYKRDAKGNLVRKWNKIERGDPCPCKSGKKFRKCCRSINTLMEELKRQSDIQKEIERKGRETEEQARSLMEKDMKEALIGKAAEDVPDEVVDATNMYLTGGNNGTV